MKKAIIIVFISLGIFLLIKNEVYILVPEESIRFRVIAASNSQEDIKVKEQVSNAIMNNISEIFNKSKIEDSRNSIVNNLNKVDSIINETLKSNNYNKPYNVDYGINYFPEKKYKGVKYPSGYYESLVITIDKGEGNNYWCVMYPPLCMIDESVDKSEYEYKFKILEIIESLKK